MYEDVMKNITREELIFAIRKKNVEIFMRKNTWRILKIIAYTLGQRTQTIWENMQLFEPEYF